MTAPRDDRPKWTEGEWIISRYIYGYRLSHIERETEKMFWTQDNYSRRIDRKDVLFRGTQNKATALFERLKSSRVLAEDERKKAWDRHTERVKALLDEHDPALFRARGEL